MKKTLFTVLIVFLCVFAAVSAQETTEIESFNFSTVGDLISWDMSGQDVYDLLDQYDIEVEVENTDEYGKTITAGKETETDKFVYVFYFDNDTEKLYEVECVTIVYDGELVVPVFQSLYEEYGFDKAEPYANESLEEYAADFDESYIVAGDYTVALLAGSAETEETYGQIALVLCNREYLES